MARGSIRLDSWDLSTPGATKGVTRVSRYIVEGSKVLLLDFTELIS